MTTHSDLLLGAYAMAPSDPAAEETFYAGVAELGVGGLELPLPLEDAPSLEPSWIARNVRPEWDLLVTCIPTVMGRLGSSPAYGRRRVVAIQVHSAPGPAGGSRDALSRSLALILSWDLAGAQVLVEHCDALVPGQTAAKGFLSIEDEIAAVGTAGVGADRLGLSINWGRSAIEGRSPRTAVKHVQAAARAGLLRAVVFSGVADTETPWGPAWSDAHVPPRGDDPALAASLASLLGPVEITATLRAAGDVPRVALKISGRPKDADVPARLAVARAALAQVACLRAHLHKPVSATPRTGAGKHP